MSGEMLGQATAPIESRPRRYLQRLWGTPDINDRQKWKTVWPSLASIGKEALSLLDAGCGIGTWALELAARRPKWSVEGIDRDPDAISVARDRAQRLGLQNVRFSQVDFFEFQPSDPVDIVLSVHSAHYQAASGLGSALFARFASWLKAGGLLLLLAPRRGSEFPQSSLLPRLRTRDVFGYDDLRVLSGGSGLILERLEPSVGRLGTLAKQVSGLGRSCMPLRLASYPVQLVLDALDGRVSMDRPSAALFLAARKPRIADET